MNTLNVEDFTTVTEELLKILGTKLDCEKLTHPNFRLYDLSNKTHQNLPVIVYGQRYNYSETSTLDAICGFAKLLHEINQVHKIVGVIGGLVNKLELSESEFILTSYLACDGVTSETGRFADECLKKIRTPK